MKRENQQPQLKQGEGKLYALAFGLLGAACFVFIPAYEVFKALEVGVLEIVSAVAAVMTTAGGVGSAYAADKQGKKKEEDERGIE